MNDLRKAVGQRLRELRESRNLTLESLAEKVGIAYNTIGSYERGERFPKPVNLQKLLDFYGVTFEELTGEAPIEFADLPGTDQLYQEYTTLQERHRQLALQLADEPHSSPRALSVEEAQRFLAAASEHPLYPAILLALATGMRRGEVLGLRWQDIDFDKGILYVNQALVDIYGHPKIKPTKTESGERCIPIPPLVLEALRKHQLEQEKAASVLGWESIPDLVFTTSKGTRIHPRNFNRTITTLKKKAGLEGVSPHVLRHTFATRLLEKNIHPRIAQELLGHASPTTTETIYSHVMLGLKQQAINTMSEVLEEMGAAKPLQNECESK